MPDPAAAASAIICHGDKVLFVRSTRTREWWAFPGGKSEAGESQDRTAMREAMEEVGLDIEITGYVGTYAAGHGADRFEIACFAATAASSHLKVDADEILEARWCTLSEGLDLNLVSTAREALARFSGLPCGA